MRNIAQQIKTTMATEQTVSIVLHVPESIYYPMKEKRDKVARKQKVLLKNELVRLMEIGYKEVKTTLIGK